MKILKLLILLGVCLLCSCTANKKNSESKPMEKASAKSIVPEAVQRQADALFFDALKAKIRNDHQKAEALYFKIIDLVPDYQSAHFEIAMLKAGQGNLSEAVVFAEKSYRLDSQNEWFMLLLGELYSQQKQWEKAGNIYERLAEKYPSKFDYAYQWANTHVYRGQLKECIAVYNYLETKFGINPDWSMLKYKMYLGMEDKKSAKNEIEKLSKEFPGEVKYLEILAQMSVQQSDYRRALEIYEKIKTINPKDAYVNISLADYYLKLKAYDKAFDALEEGVRNPNLDFSTKWNVLGAYYADPTNLQGNLKDQAERLFYALIEAHPKEEKAYTIFARVASAYGNLHQAQTLLEKALALDSNKYSTWELYTYINFLVEDTQKFEASAAKCLNLFPEQLQPYLYLGLWYLSIQDYEKTIYYGQKILDFPFGVGDNIKKDVYQWMAEAYFQQKDYSSAFAMYERAMLIDPQDALLANNYAYYLSLRSEKLELAETLAKKVCQKFPDNYTYMDTYAWVLFKQKKYKEAEAVMLKAIKLSDGKETVLLEHYGDILFFLNKKGDALKYWETAKKIGARENKILDQKIEKKTWIENEK